MPGLSIYGGVTQVGAGTIPDPYTVTGTGIAPLADNMTAWAARVERHAQGGETLCELWFLRDSIWQLMPSPVVSDVRLHPILRRKYRQPAQLQLTIANGDGYLTRSNLESPYNYNLAAGYDPVIDAHRKVLLRVGTRCWGNLAAGLTPTSTLAPATGTLGQLTDGLFADFSQTTPAACQWTAVGTTAVDLLFDLGSVQMVRNVAVNFGTANRATVGFTLPASVEVLLSQDGSTYTAYPVRPVGGAGAVGVPPGDWDDDPYGAATCIPFCSIMALARYVKIRVTPVGVQIWAVDEIGIWGGAGSSFVGCNKFCGYLGDGISITSEGSIALLITDVLKKLADNNEARLTSRFGLVDLADITYSLLAGSSYWRGVSGAYDYAWQAAEIGWQTGVALTGFIIPVWQGQGNNVLGYEYQLWHEIGWHLWADGNGVLQANEPPYRQYRPDYVFAASDDGNQDVRSIVRSLSDKDIRNVVEVTTGALAGGTGGSITLTDPASVARYGHLRTIITDGVAGTADLRQKVAASTLRDYAWRLDLLHAEIAPDYDTAIKGIHAFRTGQTPNATLGRVMLRAKSCSVVGERCVQELWVLESVEEHISSGEWWGLAFYRPYVPASIDPPLMESMTPGSGGTVTQAVLLWNAADDFTIAPVSGSGAVSARSGLFTVSINGYTEATNTTVALSDGGTGGTFKDAGGSTISSLTFTASGTTHGPSPGAFSYTPSTGYSGPRILTLTASGYFAGVHVVDYTAGTGLYFPPVRNDIGLFALAGYNVYLSVIGESDPAYVLQNTSLIAAYNGSSQLVTTYTVTGLTPGNQYWVYVKAVDTNGHESEPSVIVTALAGGGAGSASGWTVTDLAASYDSVVGPDAQGYYTYQFSFLWTSPPIPAPSPDHGAYGFKRMSINYAVGALPPDPLVTTNWQHVPSDVWAGNRIAPGLGWDRLTPEQLSWQSRMRVNTIIASGTHVYFRMITSSRSTGWYGSGGHSRGLYQSNVATVVMP